MRVPPLLLVVGAALVAGCVGPGGGMPASSIPDYPRLRARLETLHTAVSSGDLETAYAIHPPYIRARLSLDEYKQEREDPGNRRFSIHAVVPCVCATVSFPPEYAPTQKALRCVLLVEGSIVRKDGSEERFRYLNTWERIEGEWYFLIPGEGEECPRPNP